MQGPQKILPADAFYDAVAMEYNSHMTENDRKAREIISIEFGKYVKSGNILDFGGGTGLDLPWLINKSNYQLFFLETSYGMREVAKANMLEGPRANEIFFVENNVDFNKWNLNTLPFTQKIDGILANFAVLNSIPNLEDFFEKIALICNKNCHLVLTVLDSRLSVIFRKYPLKNSIKYFLQKKLVLVNNYNNVSHKTYIHSLKELKSSSKAYFNYISFTPVRFSNFALLVLSRK